MAEYYKVSRRFWSDEKVLRWDDDTRLLALYLLTCPHGSNEGIFRLPKEYILADLRWTPERLEKPFMQLLADGFIMYDENVSVILLPNALKHRPTANPNQRISAVNKIDELPSTPLLERFCRLAERFDQPLAKLLKERYAYTLDQDQTQTLDKEIYMSPSGDLSQPDHEEKRGEQVDKPPSGNDGEPPEETAPADNGEKTEKPRRDVNAEVREVHQHYCEVWRDVFPRGPKLTRDRAEKIKARLKTFSVAEIKDAIEALHESDFHRGLNPSGKPYGTLDFLIRNDATMDRWVSEAARRRSGQSLAGRPSQHRSPEERQAIMARIMARAGAGGVRR